MAKIIDPVIYALCGLIALILWRWMWLRNERRKLGHMPSAHEAERFDLELDDDEKNKMYSGRVIKRLRARVVEGRVEIHWEYHPEFVHQGFVLTGKVRYGDRDWQPLVTEPFENSGSWSEDFKYGETRTYLFTVKKKYWLFFGIFGEEPAEIVYDQISVPVRKGRFLKERAEHLQDRASVSIAEYTCIKAVQQVQKTLGLGLEKSNASLPEAPVERLKRRIKSKRDLADELEKEIAAVNSHATWSEERKKKEIETLERAFEEMEMRE